MYVLIAGLVLFFAPHSLRMTAPGLRDARIAAMGLNAWKGVHTGMSLVGLGLIVWGWILFRADAPEVYTPFDWGRHVTYLLVLIAFILFAVPANSVGRIRATIRHPMLIATICWSTGHLLANGDLASVLVFGSFLVYSAINLIAVQFRADPAPVFQSLRPDISAVLFGTIIYLIFAFYVHGWLFGVAPIY